MGRRDAGCRAALTGMVGLITGLALVGGLAACGEERGGGSVAGAGRSGPARPSSTAPATPTSTPAPRPTALPVDCARARCVAITFDDGPGPDTARLLDMLARRGDRATFFVLGRNAARRPELLRRMVAAGHEIANHTYDHLDLTTLSKAQTRVQIQRTQQVVRRATGQVPRLFRPPYGSTDGRVARLVGLPQVLWKADTLDWLVLDSARVRRTVKRIASRNAVILLHDVHRTTVEAMPGILRMLHARGYTLVTVSQLYRGKTLRAGGVYGLE